jgi:hypothetical protein
MADVKLMIATHVATAMGIRNWWIMVVVLLVWAGSTGADARNDMRGDRVRGLTST